MDFKYYSVSQINKYIKDLFDKDVFLNDVFVEAEISNFKAHSAGHFYFTLKDSNASINAVMYRSNVSKLSFLPENGMRVTVYGYVSLYEKTGQYQIYVQLIEPTGKGALYTAYEQLKEKLENEGLFDSEFKKPIPEFPEIVAVVTSPTGAAVRDIINISKRRNENVKIVVVPVLVQGEQSAVQISKAIKDINLWGKADVIIVGRGGGSIEELWSFNEEKVARAIFNSKIPVISAVGHETDFTIADFVSDLRAPTPSAAAEIAVPEKAQIINYIQRCIDSLNDSVDYKLEQSNNNLKRMTDSKTFKLYLNKLYDLQIYISECQKRILREMNYKLNSKKSEFQNILSRLEGVSPVRILSSGYSIVYDESGGNIITDSSILKKGDNINIKFNIGNVKAEVLEKGEQNGKKKNFWISAFEIRRFNW